MLLLYNLLKVGVRGTIDPCFILLFIVGVRGAIDPFCILLYLFQILMIRIIRLVTYVVL